MKASISGMAVAASICILVIGTAGQSSKPESEISKALSAAPPSVAAQASIIILKEHGEREQLRAGTNGWTCMIQDPNAHDDGIAHHPACFDKYGLEWTDDYLAGRKPNPNHVGYSYMLEGGSSWSNTDPKAKKLSPGQKDYIRIPPHIMILNARIADSSGFPSSQAEPDTHKPFVMFGGTPYALLIIPVN
jgi:hypothetical protein